MLIVLRIPHRGAIRIVEYEDDAEFVTRVYRNNKETSKPPVLKKDDPTRKVYTIHREIVECPADKCISDLEWACLVSEREEYLLVVFRTREELWEFIKNYDDKRGDELVSACRKYLKEINNMKYGGTDEY